MQQRRTVDAGERVSAAPLLRKRSDGRAARARLGMGRAEGHRLHAVIVPARGTGGWAQGAA